MGATKQIARGRMEQYQGKTAKKVTYFDNVLFDGAAYFNVSLKVNVQKFENKIEFLVSMNDVQKPRDRPIIRTSSEDQEMTGGMIQMAPIMWRSRRKEKLLRKKTKTKKHAPHLTTLSSLSSFSRLISRMAVLGTPSSSASSLIFLRATIWLFVMSRALYTTP